MGSFRVGARAVIEDGEGKILMVKEAKDQIKGLWDFPGGGWDAGESIIECLKRETLEETGLQIEVEGFLGTYTEYKKIDGKPALGFIFIARAEEKVQEPDDWDEIMETRFFKPEEVEELELRTENRYEILKRYRTGERHSMDVLWNDLNLLKD